MKNFKKLFQETLKDYIKLSRGSNTAIFKIFDAKNKVMKKLWTFILSAGIIASLYQIISFANSFLNYPVVVTLEKHGKYSKLYPAITVCNLNPMKNIYKDCIKEENIPEFCNYPGSDRSEVDLSPDWGLFQFSMPMSKALSPFALNATSAGNLLKLKEIEFLNAFAKLGDISQKQYGTQARDFIKYCSFKGISCTSDDFELTQHIRFGNCYTFNSPSHDKNLLKKTSLFLDGDDLVLILSLEVYSYIKYISTSVGALVTVHDAFENPNIEEKGILVGPGYETHIKVGMTETKRLPAPYKDKCMDNRSQSVTPSNCILLCIQKINQEKCGCVDPTVNVFESDALTCTLTNIKDMRCLNDVIHNLLIYQSSCKCKIPCFSTDYNEQVWKSSWPSKAHLDNYLRFKLKVRSRENLKLFKEKYAFLKVHLESAKEIRVQKPKFDVSEFFSCLGGSLGLYLGISCMTIFEVVEILVEILKLRFF